MEIDPKHHTPEENYKLITGLIVPRPIAWITTLCDDGTINLAPFSAFNLMTHEPPMLMVSIGTREGQRKDTYSNILSRKEFVVNIASYEFMETVHASSAALPHGKSETELLQLETVPCTIIKTPRLKNVVAAMECRLRDRIQYEDADSAILVGDILKYHVRDDLVRNAKIDTRELDPLARIGGPNYAGLGRFKTMPAAEVLMEKLTEKQTETGS